MPAGSFMSQDGGFMSQASMGPSSGFDVNPVSLSDNPFMTQKDMRRGPPGPRSAGGFGSQDPFGQSKGDSKFKVDWANWAGMEVTGKMNELIAANGLNDPTNGESLLKTFGDNARGKVKILKVSKGAQSLSFEEDKKLGDIYDLTQLFEDQSWKKDKISAQEEAYDAADNEMDPVEAWVMGFEPDGSRRIDKWNNDANYVEAAPDGSIVDAKRVAEMKKKATAPELLPDVTSEYKSWFIAGSTEHTSHQQMLASRYFRELCALVETRRADRTDPKALDVMWTNDPKVFPLPKELRAEGREGLPPWEQGVMPFPPEQRQFFVPARPSPDTYSIDVYISDWENLFPEKTQGQSPRGQNRQGQNQGSAELPVRYRAICSTGLGGRPSHTSIFETDWIDPTKHNGFHDWGRQEDYKMPGGPGGYMLPEALSAGVHPVKALEHLDANQQEEYGLTFHIVDQYGNNYAQGRAPPSWYYNWHELRNYRPNMGMALRMCANWMAVPMTLHSAPAPQGRGQKDGGAAGAKLWVHVRIYAGKEGVAAQKGIIESCFAPKASAGPQEGASTAPESKEWDLQTSGDDDSNVFGPIAGRPEKGKPQAASGGFIERSGYLAAGQDLQKATMTADEAKRYAMTLPKCVGFTFKGPTTTNPVEINFKSRWDFTDDPGYTSYQKEAHPEFSHGRSNVQAKIPIVEEKFLSEDQEREANEKRWCRLTEFGHTSSEMGFAVVFDTTDKEKSNCGRVNKGAQFDNLYFVEALNAISCRPKVARQLFYAWDVSKGIYILRLMCNGTWVRVEIDDYVLAGGDAKPACSYSENFPYVLWPSLVEKAYAKIHTVRPPYGNSGGWEGVGGGGRVEEALADLTGGVAGRFSTKDAAYDRLFIYFYHLQRYCIWVARANKSACQKHGVVLAEGQSAYVLNRAAPWFGETYVQLFSAGFEFHIDGAGLQSFSVPLELQNNFPEKPGSGYFWVHMLDFAMYFDMVFECRLTNSPDVGLKDMPDFPLPMHLNIPVAPDAKTLGPNIFKEIVVANKGAITPNNPPEFTIFVPGGACPCEISAVLSQVNPRTDQLGPCRPLAHPLLLKVYQQTGMGGDNYSQDLVCKSNWLPIRDAMICFSAKSGGRFLVTCGFHDPTTVLHTLIFRVYSSCDGVVVTADRAMAPHSVAQGDADEDAPRAIKWTLVGCRAAHQSDDTQPEPYNALSDGLKLPLSDEQSACSVM